MATREYTRNYTRGYFLIFGGVFSFLSAQHLIRYALMREDIWWTPQALAESIEGSRPRVEVYVQDTRLADQLKSGRLLIASEGGPRALGPSDVTLRLNNWDRVRAERIPFLLSAAAGLGAAGVILLLGIIGWVPEPRPERQPQKRSDVA